MLALPAASKKRLQMTAEYLPQPGVSAAVAVAGCHAPVGALAGQVEDRAAVTITLVNLLFGLALVGQTVEHVAAGFKGNADESAFIGNIVAWGLPKVVRVSCIGLRSDSVGCR